MADSYTHSQDISECPDHPGFLSYEEAAAYIEEIPRFTKKHTLEHTKEFLRRLGNPAFDRKYRKKSLIVNGDVVPPDPFIDGYQMRGREEAHTLAFRHQADGRGRGRTSVLF